VNLIIYDILHAILSLLLYSIMAYVIMGWLVAFNVINRRSPIVFQIERVLSFIVEPILEPFRRILPNVGGLDLSPFVAGIIVGAADKLLRGLL